MMDESRRKFLAGATVAGAGLIAPGMVLVAAARNPDEPVSSQVRWGLLIDTSKCATGCDACVAACFIENGIHRGDKPTDSQWIRKVELRNKATGVQHSLPVMCQHCEHPPCADVCPTGASFKRADGLVLVDRHLCIGCRYCMMACPYKARSFVHEPLTDQKPEVPRGMGCVESCTLCVHRIDRGERPACVEACAAHAAGAMTFGDLNDPDSEIARAVRSSATTRLRADLALNPGVSYTGI